MKYRNTGAVLRGAARPRPNKKCGSPVAPHFGHASLDFHLNRPVISLIQLHIVPPAPSWNCGLHCSHLTSARTAPVGTTYNSAASVTIRPGRFRSGPVRVPSSPVQSDGPYPLSSSGRPERALSSVTVTWTDAGRVSVGVFGG